MTFLAILTFDLTDADSADYECLDSRLSTIGFSRQLAGSDGKTLDLPYNTYAGQFTGEDVGSVRDALRNRAKQAFDACSVHGRQFVAVCNGWAWGMGSF